MGRTRDSYAPTGRCAGRHWPSICAGVVCIPERRRPGGGPSSTRRSARTLGVSIVIRQAYRSGVAETVEERVRAICMSLPEVTEKLSHGTPAFFVRKQFVMLWPDGHHEHRFAHLWCAAPTGAQDELVDIEPERFFRPPYVGGRGWLGVRLDGHVDWDELAAVCKDAYRTVAPAKLVATLDVAET